MQGILLFLLKSNYRFNLIILHYAYYSRTQFCLKDATNTEMSTFEDYFLTNMEKYFTMCDYCSWVEQILSRLVEETKKLEKVTPKPARVDPVIIVHGGAGRIPKNKRQYMLNEVKNAAIKAYQELIYGCSAIDAVETAICYLESKKYFNCGKESSLDASGEVVMDAAIMTNDCRVGCIGAVRDIEHPIMLAKKVLEKTNHVLIVESGAQKLAIDEGFTILPPGYLVAQSTPIDFSSIYSMSEEEEEEDTNELFIENSRTNNPEDNFDITDTTDITEREEAYSLRDLELINKELNIDKCSPDCVVEKAKVTGGEHLTEMESKKSEPSKEIICTFLQVDAVGAVAYDRKKQLSCGTSTGGQPDKAIGSITAVGTVVGCGIYADENGCCSVSGEDKAIYKYAPARKIVRRLAENTTVVLAVDAELENFEKVTKESHIGAVALNNKGEPSISFKSVHFPWAYCYMGYVYYGCLKNDRFSEEIKVLKQPLDCMCENHDDCY